MVLGERPDRQGAGRGILRHPNAKLTFLRSSRLRAALCCAAQRHSTARVASLDAQRQESQRHEQERFEEQCAHLHGLRRDADRRAQVSSGQYPQHHLLTVAVERLYLHCRKSRRAVVALCCSVLVPLLSRLGWAMTREDTGVRCPATPHQHHPQPPSTSHPTHHSLRPLPDLLCTVSPCLTSWWHVHPSGQHHWCSCGLGTRSTSRGRRNKTLPWPTC